MLGYQATLSGSVLPYLALVMGYRSVLVNREVLPVDQSWGLLAIIHLGSILSISIDLLIDDQIYHISKS